MHYERYRHMAKLDLSIFDLSPIPMWLQDFSGIRRIFDAWTAEGITDIKQYLLEDPNRFRPCLASIETVHINQSTLRLYEAKSLDEILQSFSKMHFEDITTHQIHFFVSIFERSDDYIIPAVNYTCTGKQIDVQLRANLIDGYEENWERVLLTTEDISAYQKARRFAESLINYSPTPLWIKDYSKVKALFTELRNAGITDLKQHLKDHPDFLQHCFNQILFIDINQATLNLFRAKNKNDFFHNLNRIFSIYIHQSFSDQLLQLWQGNYYQQRECTYYATDGQIIHVLEQFNIFPQNEEDWGIIQVALTDITERKQMENHLQYLGKHDILTKLYNRTFYNEEILRLEENLISPVSCIFLDMNGLKKINDTFGHDEGDKILKRMGNILQHSILDTQYSVSRIGGDEFVILMPNADENDAQHLQDNIQQLIDQDNISFPAFPISVAMGYSTTENNESIDDSLKRADQKMYKKKSEYYQIKLN